MNPDEFKNYLWSNSPNQLTFPFYSEVYKQPFYYMGDSFPPPKDYYDFCGNKMKDPTLPINT